MVLKWERSAQADTESAAASHIKTQYSRTPDPRDALILPHRAIVAKALRIDGAKRALRQPGVQAEQKLGGRGGKALIISGLFLSFTL